MDWKLKFANVMYLCIAVTFTLSVTVVTGIFMTILVIFIWPINKSLYRKLIKYLGYTLFAQAVFMLRWWATMDFKLYVDRSVFENHLGKEHSLLIMNHSGELDWIAVASLLDNLNILGNCKSFIKKSVLYIPFIGWGFYLCEFIFLSRSFEKDKLVIRKLAKDLSEHQEPATIYLFPEGTRFTPQKHKEAIEFCKQRGLKELKHHLVPRTKGFSATVPFLKGKIPAIYDIEIAFKGMKPTIANMLKGRHFEVHMYLRRIPMEDVPDDEEAQDLYLRDMFYRKDELMDSFKRTGDYFALNNYERYEAIDIDRPTNSLYNMMTWFLVVLSSICYYFFNLLIGGHYISLAVAFILIAFSFRMMAKTIDAMEVKNDAEEGRKSENGLNRQN